MENENKFLTFIKNNFVFVLTLVVMLCAFISMAGAFVTTKAVSITYRPDWEWYEVVKVAGREGVSFGSVVKSGLANPFIAFYCLVAVSIVFTVLGKVVNKNFYTVSMLVLLCTGVMFITGNIFFDLAQSIKAGEPNLLEDVRGVAETKLAFGTTFAAMICFVSGIMNFTLGSSAESFKTRDLVEIGIFSAMAIGLQFIKIQIGATGGSINLGLLPLFIIALRHGPVKGFIASAFVFGLITCLTDGYGFNTYPFDYMIGFGGTALLGCFKSLCFKNNEKGYSGLGFVFILIGVILASVVRFVGSSASSMINYGYTLKAAAAYNVIYVFVTGAVNAVAMMALYVPLAIVNKRFPVK